MVNRASTPKPPLANHTAPSAPSPSDPVPLPILRTAAVPDPPVFRS